MFFYYPDIATAALGYGGRATYYDNQGNIIGTAYYMHTQSTHYDKHGQEIGKGKHDPLPRKSIYYDMQGNIIGYGKGYGSMVDASAINRQVSIHPQRDTFYDNDHRELGTMRNGGRATYTKSTPTHERVPNSDRGKSKKSNRISQDRDDNLTFTDIMTHSYCELEGLKPDSSIKKNFENIWENLFPNVKKLSVSALSSQLKKYFNPHNPKGLAKKLVAIYNRKVMQNYKGHLFPSNAIIMAAIKDVISLREKSGSFMRVIIKGTLDFPYVLATLLYCTYMGHRVEENRTGIKVSEKEYKDSFLAKPQSAFKKLLRDPKFLGDLEGNSDFYFFLSGKNASILLEPLEKGIPFTYLSFVDTSLTESRTQELAKYLYSNKTLQNLSIGERIEDKGAQEFATALTLNNYLTSLSLYNAWITDIGATKLASSLKENNSLRYLELSGNKITDKGAQAFATILSQNVFLKTLFLSRNTDITDISAKAFADALKTNSTLSVLCLDGTQITNDGATELVNALNSNFTITYLRLEWDKFNPDLKQRHTTLTERNKALSNELLDAAKRGDVDRLIELNKKGVSIRVRDDRGYTALHVSAMNNQIETVRFILSQSSDLIPYKTYHGNKPECGKTAFELAQLNNHLDCVRLIQQATTGQMSLDKEALSKRNQKQPETENLRWIEAASFSGSRTEDNPASDDLSSRDSNVASTSSQTASTFDSLGAAKNLYLWWHDSSYRKLERRTKTTGKLDKAISKFSENPNENTKKELSEQVGFWLQTKPNSSRREVVLELQKKLNSV